MLDILEGRFPTSNNNIDEEIEDESVADNTKARLSQSNLETDDIFINRARGQRREFDSSRFNNANRQFIEEPVASSSKCNITSNRGSQQFVGNIREFNNTNRQSIGEPVASTSKCTVTSKRGSQHFMENKYTGTIPKSYKRSSDIVEVSSEEEERKEKIEVHYLKRNSALTTFMKKTWR